MSNSTIETIRSPPTGAGDIINVVYTVSRDDVLGWIGSVDDALRAEINAKLAKYFRI